MNKLLIIFVIIAMIFITGCVEDNNTSMDVPLNVTEPTEEITEVPTEVPTEVVTEVPTVMVTVKSTPLSISNESITYVPLEWELDDPDVKVSMTPTITVGLPHPINT